MKVLNFISILAFIALWQLLSWVGVLPTFKFPSPKSVIMALFELGKVGLPPGYTLIGHMGDSLNRVAVGYLIAICAGIPMGLIIGRSRWVAGLLRPVVEMVRPIPPLAWIPIAILWFGIGLKSAAFIIFLGAFFPILLNTISGVQNMDKVIIEASRTLGITEKQLIIKVLFPGALPSVITGLRIGIGIAWMTLVAAEFTGVRTGYGLGYMIMTARDLQRSDQIVAGMAVIGMIGFTLDAFFSMVEKRALRWR